MNKTADRFLNIVTHFNAYVPLIIAVTGYALYWLNWLNYFITILVWQLILILLAPHALFLVARLLWLKQKKIYKTGDFVSIVADQRKFVLIRYHRYIPLYAVCKEYDSCSVITLHQKYLTPWVEPKRFEELMRNMTTKIKQDKTIPISKMEIL